MKARLIAFGEIEIEGRRYERDVVIAGGEVRRRHKGPSKPLRDRYGHTPLTAAEEIPWGAGRLIVGTGHDAQLPVAPDVYVDAASRGIVVVAMPTAEACALLETADAADVYAVLHVSC